MRIIDKEDCCGCGTCYQICPNDAIAMKPDGEGFLYPEIDEKKCVNCGLCEKSCPLLNKNNTSENEKKTIVAISDESDRLMSSSGGMFSLLAKSVLKNNGVVFGAVYDADWLVHHKYCEDEEKLQEFLESKYLQSDTKRSYIDVKEMLIQGREVLYVGTACQIAGLKNYLKKDYENLYTVDILCHGVPSPAVWKRYISDLEKTYGSKVKEVHFRDKKTGWHDYSLTISFNNGDQYTKKHGDDPYMGLFLTNSILRPSCYRCEFKGMDRYSDLTIGDAWGIEKLDSEMDDNKGTSVIIVHTVKGERMLEAIGQSINQRTIDLDKILPATAASRKPVKKPKSRAVAFFYYKHNASITKMCSSYEKSIKGIILRKLIRN